MRCRPSRLHALEVQTWPTRAGTFAIDLCAGMAVALAGKLSDVGQRRHAACVRFGQQPTRPTNCRAPNVRPRQPERLRDGLHRIPLATRRPGKPLFSEAYSTASLSGIATRPLTRPGVKSAEVVRVSLCMKSRAVREVANALRHRPVRKRCLGAAHMAPLESWVIRPRPRKQKALQACPPTCGVAHAMSQDCPMIQVRNAGL